MDVIFLEQNVVQEAVIWFVPVIVLAGTIIATIIGEVIIDEINKKTIGMAVLGMQGAGKTTWYNYLTKEKRKGQTTTHSVGKIEMRLENGKKLIIKSGTDIGGVDEYQYKYNEMVEENDIILFLFSLKAYKDDKLYQRRVHSRIDLIQDKMNDEKYLYVIMTHSDQVQDKAARMKAESNIQNVLKSVKNSQYDLVNMTCKEDCEKIKKKIF